MPKEEKPELREYAAVLCDMPQAHAVATDALNKLIAGVRDTGKAGTLAVKFKVSVSKLNESMIEIQPDVAISIPKQALRGAGFYPDENNNITKDDPSQLWRDEDIRSAPAFVDLSTGEIKEAPKA